VGSKKKTKNPPKKAKSSKKWLFIIVAIFLFFGIVSGGVFAFQYFYKGKIYPGIKVAGENLMGLTKEQAQDKLTQKLAGFDAKELKANANGKEFSQKLEDLQIQFDLEKTVEKAVSEGRNEKWYLNLKKQVLNLFGKQVDLDFGFSEPRLNQFVLDVATNVDEPAVNATFALKNGDLEITGVEKDGKVISKEELREKTLKSIGKFSFDTIEISRQKAEPELKAKEILEAKEDFLKYVQKPLVLKYSGGSITITTEKLALLINFKKKVDSQNLEATPDGDKIEKYLKTQEAKINQAPKNAVLGFVSGEIKVLEQDKDGVALDLEKTTWAVISALNEGSPEVVVKTKASKAQVRQDNIEELGITELLGQGKSDFRGSSTSRIQNIKVGAAKFHGALVAPGAEFSFDTILGPVDASTGFLPELVILKDKMTKQYGGGLCQVATTAFRAAFWIGVPITERKNHAFRVGHYDWPYGPGMDATIYPPHPDLKFKNDTGHYILIQTSISGNILTFDFYGAKDGRTVKMEGPVTLEKNADGSMKTTVSQLVYNPDGSLKRKSTFNSNYDSPSKYPKVQ